MTKRIKKNTVAGTERPSPKVRKAKLGLLRNLIQTGKKIIFASIF